MKTINVSAPGKVIIAGEHAVVYGYPALLAATDKRLYLELTACGSLPALTSFKAQNLAHLVKLLKKHPQVDKLVINSDIPVGSGMGSSAALAVCLAAAWLGLKQTSPDLQSINDLAYELEKLQHGNPSGGDNSISCYGGMLWFRKETPTIKIFKRIDNIPHIKNLYLLDSGKPTENTKEMVAQVASQRQANPHRIKAAFEDMETIARGWLNVVTTSDQAKVKELVKSNHRHLVDIGVVSATTQKLIKQIEESGGAAKITGAGGKSKGSGMLLVYHESYSFLIKNMNKLELSKVIFSEEGVRYE